MRHNRKRYTCPAASLTVAILLLANGCDVDVRDGLGPRVPEPDIEGAVLRGSAPAIRVDVELHNVASDAKVFDTSTNRYGLYGFPDVPAGIWEVRVESDVPGDFASVSRQFYRTDSDGQLRLPNFDVSTRGGGLVSPAAGAATIVPTPFDPLDFRWSSPDVAGTIAHVQLSDSLGQDVWKSSRAMADSVRWYGYGSEGLYENTPVTPGVYEWRVKFEFADTTEARTERRLLRLQ
jgi:hypothetical protein